MELDLNEQIAHFFNLEKYREPGIACINFIRPPKHAIRPVVFDGQSSMPLIKNQVIYCRFIANIADAELLDDIALQPGTGKRVAGYIESDQQKEQTD